MRRRAITKRNKKRKNNHLFNRSSIESKEKSSKTKETDEYLQEERKEAYLERPSQNLLRSLLKNGNNAEIIPIYDPKLGFIYRTAEQAFEEEISTPRSFRLSRTSYTIRYT